MLPSPSPTHAHSHARVQLHSSFIRPELSQHRSWITHGIDDTQDSAVSRHWCSHEVVCDHLHLLKTIKLEGKFSVLLTVRLASEKWRPLLIHTRRSQTCLPPTSIWNWSTSTSKKVWSQTKKCNLWRTPFWYHPTHTARLLSFICGHNLQTSRQYPGNRNCMSDTICVYNKAIIIIIPMEICKLPTYQNICVRIGCCKGQVQFNYHFTHIDIGHRDSPFQVVFGHFCFSFVDEKCLHIPCCWRLLPSFCEIGTWYAFGNHTGHCGRTKSPFCRAACKTHVSWHDDFLSRMDLKTVL